MTERYSALPDHAIQKNNVTKNQFLTEYPLPKPVQRLIQAATPQETIFTKEYLQERERRKTRKQSSKFANVVKRIPDEYINPDGTLQVDDIRDLEYFKKNPYLIDEFNLENKQLSPKSEKRKRALEREKNNQTSHIHEHSHHEHELFSPHQHYHDEASSHTQSTETKPLINKGFRNVLLGGNFIIGVSEILTGVPPVVVDGIHSAGGDTISYGFEARNILNKNLSTEQKEKGRKISYGVIFGANVIIGGLAMRDVVADFLSPYYTSVPHPYVLHTAILSLGLNLFLLSRAYPEIRKRRKNGTNTVYDETLIKHLLHVDTTSAALAVVGAIAHKNGINLAEHMAALISSGIGAYAFRPTKKNFEQPHQCLLHDHGDEIEHGHGHGHHHEYSFNHDQEIAVIANRGQKNKFRRTIAGAATIAILGAGLAGSAAKTVTESPEKPSKGDAGHALVLPTPEERIPDRKLEETDSVPIVTEKISIKKSDSQWRIVENKIKDAGHNPSTSLTNVIVDIVAFENKFSDPDIIYAKKKLKVPTAPVIDIIADALEMPLSPHATDEEKQFANDLESA